MGEDGADGLEQFKEFQPNITFLDLTKALINGFEAPQQVHKVDPKAMAIKETGGNRALVISDK